MWVEPRRLMTARRSEMTIRLRCDRCRELRSVQSVSCRSYPGPVRIFETRLVYRGGAYIQERTDVAAD